MLLTSACTSGRIIGSYSRNECFFFPSKSFFLFIPSWGRFPFWLIFFKWVEPPTSLFFQIIMPSAETFRNVSGKLSGKRVCPNQLLTERKFRVLRSNVTRNPSESQQCLRTMNLPSWDARVWNIIWSKFLLSRRWCTELRVRCWQVSMSLDAHRHLHEISSLFFSTQWQAHVR